MENGRIDSAEAPAASATCPPGRRGWKLPAPLIVLLSVPALFLLLGSLTPPLLADADAALYLHQIRGGDLTQRTVHVGYLALGVACTRLFSRIHLAPAGSDRALNLMSALFGAVCLALLFALARRLLGSASRAALAAALLLCHGLFLLHSLFAEVYIVQAAFLTAAVLLWVEERPLTAGCALAGSLLVTPSSYLALPFFLLWRRRPGEWALLLAPAILLWAVAIYPVRQDYFWGPRGLGQIPQHPLRLFPAMFKEGKELLLGFSFTLPWVVAGVWKLVWDPRRRNWIVSLGGLWLGGFLLGEHFGDVPVQLPLYVLLCPVAAVGAEPLLSPQGRRVAHGRLRFLPAGLAPPLLLGLTLVLSLAVSGARVWDKVRTSRDLLRRAELLDRQMGPREKVIASWGTGVLLEHDMGREPYSGLWIDLRSGRAIDLAVAQRRGLWLLSPPRDLEERLERAGYSLEAVTEKQPREGGAAARNRLSLIHAEP